MHLPRPESLADIIADGIIEQASIDRVVGLGHSTQPVEFHGPVSTDPEWDAPVQVVLGTTTTVPGTRVAVIRDGTWHWLTHRAHDLGLPELTEPQPASDDLLRAARTLFSGYPGLYAPHGSQTASVVILNDAPAPAPVTDALVAGLPAARGPQLRRALTSFAAQRNLTCDLTDPHRALLSDGTTITLAEDIALDLPSRGPTLAEVRADAHALAAEYQLFFDGRFPNRTLRLSIDTATAELHAAGQELTVKAYVLGTAYDDAFTWAWADEQLTQQPTAAAAHHIRRYAADHGLFALLHPTLPLAEVHRLGLIEATKPLTQRWIHAEVPLTPTATAIVALEHPALTLPAPTAAAIEATLATPIPDGLDASRTLGFYATARGLTATATGIVDPATGRELTPPAPPAPATRRVQALVAVDMDGTLLDADGEIPADFWPLLRRAHHAGVLIAPASGRQLATLQQLFPSVDTFIAENGTIVVAEGQIISTTAIAPDVVRRVITAATDLDAYLVVCTPKTAYILPGAPAEVRAEIARYYHAVTETTQLTDVADADVIKLALYTTREAEEYLLPTIREVAAGQAVAVSGQHWLDVMSAQANKGLALRELAATLGLTTAQTVAFGDYLNDYELLSEAGTAVAVANAHPRLKEIADRIAPPNTEHGVITELTAMLPDWEDADTSDER